MNDCDLCSCMICQHEQDRSYCGGCEQCEVENRSKITTDCPDFQKIN